MNVFHMKFSNDGTLLYGLIMKGINELEDGFSSNLEEFSIIKSEVPSLFSYHVEKLVVREIEETDIRNTQFFEDLGIFLKKLLGNSKEMLEIWEIRFYFAITCSSFRECSSFRITSNPPIFIDTVDSKKPKINDYLSEEEYNELPFMEQVEYSLRNKIVTKWKYEIPGKGFILYKLTPSSDLQWKKRYLLTEDDVGEIYVTKILPSTSTDYANVFGKIVDPNEKISFFHLTINTFDGSIEKTESYTTKKKHFTYGNSFSEFEKNDILTNKPAFFRTFGRNIEHFYLFPESPFIDEYPFIRLNFNNKEVHCFEIKENIRIHGMEDIFWIKDEDRLIFRLELYGRHHSDYYFDEETPSFKLNYQTEFDFNFLFSDEVENGTYGYTLAFCDSMKRRKGEKKGYIHLCLARELNSQEEFIYHKNILVTEDEFKGNEQCGVFKTKKKGNDFQMKELKVKEVSCEEEWIIDENNEVLKCLEVVDIQPVLKIVNDEDIKTKDVDESSSSLEFIDFCKKAPQKNVYMWFILLFLLLICVVLIVVILFFVKMKKRKEEIENNKNVLQHQEVFGSSYETSTSSSELETSEESSSMEV